MPYFRTHDKNTFQSRTDLARKKVSFQADDQEGGLT